MKKAKIFTVAILFLFTVFIFVGCVKPACLSVTLEGGEGITFQWYDIDEKVPDTEYFNVWLVKRNDQPIAILEGVDSSLKQTKGEKEQDLAFTVILLYGDSDTEAPVFTVKVGETILQPKSVEKRNFYWSNSYLEETTPEWEECWHYNFEQGGYLTSITLEMFKD